MKKAFNSFLLFFFFTNTIFIQGCENGKDPNPDNPTPTPEPEEIYDLRVNEMHVRDPFILVDRENQVYYMHVNGNKKVRVYKSKDLTMWKDMGIAFNPSSDFWGKSDFWAPDVYHYQHKYYMFITLSAPNIKRGTSVLVADKPEGPFTPVVNRAVTPSEWMSLDGALYVDKDKTPWIIYCHEWLEAGDGEVVAQQLKEDLTETVGEPKVLFKASEAPWVGDISSGNTTGKVTDAPFIHTLDNGLLIMLWSSFRKDGKYAIGQATSQSGDLLGPWTQEAEPLNDDDGGHAMLFNDVKGRLMISYHAPNSNTERPLIKQVYINNGKVMIPD
ncbi:glycoside hydrolase family 43 protein [Proteiniphilum sp. X52]|uniref:glycoside hydrolase family 43 protein n=1 Tax=Proteiniphilum sp. X52 TaxID=2382159 RepID=UPI000F09D712|nr:glycoside hydrolase family 43 protein [Proteiniphilum sp. X52]RNC66720.1 glycosyl hydrolase family 43 [Proteiniphilum sp. X52]